MSLPQRLKHFRAEAKKTQKNVEKEIGIPQATLSGWENGLSEPSASDLIKLAKCYRVSELKLLHDNPPGTRRKKAI